MKLISTIIILILNSADSTAQNHSSKGTQQTLVKNIPSASFIPFKGGSADTLFGCLNSSSATQPSDEDMYAPVILPTGSIITGINAHFWDWAFSNNVRPKLTLRRHDGKGELVELAIAQSKLPNNGPTFYEQFSEIDPPYELQQTDFLDLYFEVGEVVTLGYWICGVEIYYTNNTP